MQARKQSYTEAGSASAENSGGNANTRSKITGSMAAVPIVEHVLGMAKNIVDRTSIALGAVHYSENAGSGFHMAVQDQNVQTKHWVAALAQIEYVRIWFGEVVQEWSTRLASLRGVQTRLGGDRPDPDIPSADSGASPGAQPLTGCCGFSS